MFWRFSGHSRATFVPPSVAPFPVFLLLFQFDLMFDQAVIVSLERWLHRFAFRILALTGLLSALAAAGCSELAQKERELTFRVAPGIASWYSGLPEGVVESRLPVKAGGKLQHLHTWWWPSKDPNSLALLYLHGVRWNLTGQAFRIEQLHEFGFSVLAVDYRGFGQSDGDMPSEKTVYEDARLAWQRLIELQPNPAKRFIYGHSLGGAVAIDLAAQLSAANASPLTKDSEAAAGLIVESSFTTLADTAKSLTYPWLPLQWVMSQKFNSVEKITKVDVPILVVHGTGDKFIPSRFSEELFAAAPQRKRLLLIPGATHNNSMRLGAAAYRQAFQDLFGIKSDVAPKLAMKNIRKTKP